MNTLKVNKLYNLDCREGLEQLEDDSIDCCITSPPYWNLRDYGIEPSVWDVDVDCEHDFELKKRKIENHNSEGKSTIGGMKEGITGKHYFEEGFCSKCGAWKGCLGLEPNFELYINHLCDIYDQVKRVLKGTGTCWVNMGDSYGSGGSSNTTPSKSGSFHGGNKQHRTNIKMKTKLPAKCLLMIPQRFAIEMINRGWILRNVIIWHKPNCMPSSAKDRFTVDFEYVYFFVKKKRYWFEQQREKATTKIIWSRNSNKGGVQAKNNPHATWGYTREELKLLKTQHESEKRFKRGNSDHHKNINGAPGQTKHTINQYRENNKNRVYPYLGKNKRTVWKIPTKPNPEAHFATFPPDLVKPMILSGCPEFVCVECGKPRVKIMKHNGYIKAGHGGGDKKTQDTFDMLGLSETSALRTNMKKNYELKGYSDCGCKADFEPGIVLDLFTGIGTTLKQAWKLGRNYIGFEISKEYCQIAKRYLKSTKNKRVSEFI